MMKKDPIVIKDLETLRVIADPLRKQILEILIPEVLTVKQVADRLGLAPSKLYYHFNQLEERGLIQVVETRQVANMLEKSYRAAASSLEVDPELFSFSTPEGKQNIHSLASAAIDVTREDLLRSLEARAYQLDQGAKEQPRNLILTRQLSRISDARAGEFHNRLRSLIDEFEAPEDSPGEMEGRQAYALTIAFYPSFYFNEEE